MNNIGTIGGRISEVRGFKRFDKGSIWLGNAYHAATRFIGSSEFIGEGSFVGIRIDTVNCKAVVFSSEGTRISTEDYNWIFSGFATVTEPVSEIIETSSEKKSVVYRLITATGDNSGSFGSHESEDIDMLFEMLREQEAVICIVAGASDGRDTDIGAIYISLSGQMTLRLRGMLSLTMPEVRAQEVKSIQLPGQNEKYLSRKKLCDSMAILMNPLCRNAKRTDENAEDKSSDDDVSDLFDTDDSTLEDDADIEELNFSVRTYNCLKRAGITSVGQLKMLNDCDFRKIRNLGAKSIKEIKSKIEGLTDTEPQDTAAEEEKDYDKLLEEMIGLDGVKAQIKKIKALAELKKRAENVDGRFDIALNMAFVGNPGTAKTTVARLAAKILNKAGILSSGDIIEVGRADIIAQYVGHTAANVKRIFERAQGKLLFIDEAYSLADSNTGSFGDEAINTIVQEMENRRSETVVVFAGYPKEIQELFDRNPGLKSRVPFVIHFDDYSAEEMTGITLYEADRRGFTLDGSAAEKVRGLCEEACGNPLSGNGRFCRNLVEDAILKYALRTGGIGGEKSGGGDDFVLTADDFGTPSEIADRPKRTIGFSA